jgi:hypothetical protein
MVEENIKTHGGMKCRFFFKSKRKYDFLPSQMKNHLVTKMASCKI